jgi:hypothetical protein
MDDFCDNLNIRYKVLHMEQLTLDQIKVINSMYLRGLITFNMAINLVCDNYIYKYFKQNIR